MKEMICVVCPRGCHLTVGDSPEYAVSGNFCPRGAAYGRDEVVAPKRVVTATCPLAYGDGLTPAEISELPHRVPVRTTAPIPKERVEELVAALAHERVTAPVRLGDVILENWENTGVSVIATRSIG